MSPISLKNCQFPLQTQYRYSFRLMTTHNGHSRSAHQLSFLLQFSGHTSLIHDNCVLQTLPFAILQEPPTFFTRQQAWPGLGSLTKKAFIQTWAHILLCYLNTISIAKQENPKLINLLLSILNTPSAKILFFVFPSLLSL